MEGSGAEWGGLGGVGRGGVEWRAGWGISGVEWDVVERTFAMCRGVASLVSFYAGFCLLTRSICTWYVTCALCSFVGFFSCSFTHSLFPRFTCCFFALQVALVEESVVPALKASVSELRHYCTDSGLPFRSAKLPSLRLCIHTGLDREPALLHFRNALLYTPPVSPLDQVNGQVRGGGMDGCGGRCWCSWCCSCYGVSVGSGVVALVLMLMLIVLRWF